MPGALTGIRVLDLTRIWAGPHATRILADLGAEVIHVTSRKLVGEPTVPPAQARIMSVFPGDDPGERPWNRNSQVADLARNKFDVTLELDTPEGLDLLRRLVPLSDVVVENYSPRVMPKFGLDYPRLRELNPRIVLCSMPGYGSTGPWRQFVSYGTNVDPAAGLASLMGYPGAGPHLGGNAYPDPVAGLFAAGAILTAVFHQRRTGEGQHIDLSQAEATSALVGEAALGYCLTGRVPARRGNRHERKAPHGCYPCRGEERWIVIAVSSDAEWAGLCGAIGQPAWRGDGRFATPAGRLAHADALDRELAAWSRQQDAREAMERLQAAGVPAGLVADAEQLRHDPHLNARGFFWEIGHPEAGTHSYAGQPIRLSETPARVRRPAPTLGQHNRHILGELLGLTGEQIAGLQARGIIGDRPLPRRSPPRPAEAHGPRAPDA